MIKLDLVMTAACMALLVAALLPINIGPFVMIAAIVVGITTIKNG